MKKIFLTLTGYQLTWISCVVGEYNDFSYIGIVIGMSYLMLFFYYSSDMIKSLKKCSLIFILGYTFDTILAYKGLFIIKSDLIFGFLPIWMIILWFSFSTLFVDILDILKNRYKVSFLIGFFIGPLTYYLGITIDIAKSSNLYLTMLIMAFFWGFLMYFHSYRISKTN